MIEYQEFWTPSKRERKGKVVTSTWQDATRGLDFWERLEKLPQHTDRRRNREKMLRQTKGGVMGATWKLMSRHSGSCNNHHQLVRAPLREQPAALIAQWLWIQKEPVGKDWEDLEEQRGRVWEKAESQIQFVCTLQNIQCLRFKDETVIYMLRNSRCPGHTTLSIHCLPHLQKSHDWSAPRHHAQRSAPLPERATAWGDHCYPNHSHHISFANKMSYIQLAHLKTWELWRSTCIWNIHISFSPVILSSGGPTAYHQSWIKGTWGARRCYAGQRFGCHQSREETRPLLGKNWGNPTTAGH